MCAYGYGGWIGFKALKFQTHYLSASLHWM
jgi:hypothetical protein